MGLLGMYLVCGIGGFVMRIGSVVLRTLCYTWDVTVTLNNGGDITWGRRFSVANLGPCSGIFELHFMDNKAKWCNSSI